MKFFSERTVENLNTMDPMDNYWRILNYNLDQTRHADAKIQSLQTLGGIFLTGLLTAGAAISGSREGWQPSFWLSASFISALLSYVLLFLTILRSYMPNTSKSVVDNGEINIFYFGDASKDGYLCSLKRSRNISREQLDKNFRQICAQISQTAVIASRKHENVRRCSWQLGLCMFLTVICGAVFILGV